MTAAVDVMPSPVGSGGAPHTRCVSGVSWGAVGGAERATMRLSSKDVACVCTGKATPFPTPRNVAPDMTDGVSFNVYNNIWNTNYGIRRAFCIDLHKTLTNIRDCAVLWYPFDPRDANLKSRFLLSFSE